MDRETRQVLNGVMSLSLAQRQELVQAWNAYIEAAEIKKIELSRSNKEAIRVSVGPYAGAICKCCGK